MTGSEIGLAALAVALVAAVVALMRSAGRVREAQRHLEAARKGLAELERERRELHDTLERRRRDEPKVQRRARHDALRPVLDLADDLQRARGSEGDEAALREGLDLMARQLDRAWTQAGLEKIAPAQGDAFDPERHEALGRRESEEVAGPTVDAVVRTGFADDEGLLRAAQVFVVVPPIPRPERAEDEDEQQA